MNLADPATLSEFLRRHGLWARKGLGQHFLCSAKAVERIVGRCMGCAGVLEIGPGPGVLTGPLTQSARVIAIEVDEAMVCALRESAPDAEVRKLDALTADLSAILEELPSPRAVVSNLPYYITGPLLTAIAGASAHYDKAVLMMQREVAVRVAAPAGSSARGSLSVFLQATFQIAKVCDVPAGAFYPPPKVESTVLEFVPSTSCPPLAPASDGEAASPPPLAPASAGEAECPPPPAPASAGKAESPPPPALEEEGVGGGGPLPEAFFAFVRAGFDQPRKTLANNLAARLQLTRSDVAAWLGLQGLSATVRPHELTLGEWDALWRHASRGGT